MGKGWTDIDLNQFVIAVGAIAISVNAALTLWSQRRLSVNSDKLDEVHEKVKNGPSSDTVEDYEMRVGEQIKDLSIQVEKVLNRQSETNTLLAQHMSDGHGPSRPGRRRP